MEEGQVKIKKEKIVASVYMVLLYDIIKYIMNWLYELRILILPGLDNSAAG